MHINYILNLLKKKNKYKGSGSFELNGSALARIPEKVYQNIKFSINQIGTNYDNKNLTIYQIQGFGNNPIYATSSNYGENLFNNQNLFTDSEIVQILTNKYNNDLEKYQNIISFIDQKLQEAPLPVDNEIPANIKFNLKEIFINLINQNKQVISIYGSDINPLYVSDSETATSSEALTPPENVEHIVSKNNNLINIYSNKLDVINQKISGMIPPSDITKKTNVKFFLKEDGYNDLNQPTSIKSIIGATTDIFYESNEGLYAQNELLDDSEASGYFLRKYDNQLNKYLNKLAEINGRLNA